MINRIPGCLALMFMALCVSASFALAQTPAISGVSGSVVHQGDLLINGADFGVKDPAGPLRWFNMENGTAGERVGESGCGSSGLGLFSYAPAATRVSSPVYLEFPRGKSQLASYHDYSNGVYNRSLGVCNLFTQKIYVSIWSYFHDKSGRPSRNIKCINSSAAAIPEGSPDLPQLRVGYDNLSGQIYAANCSNTQTTNDYFGSFTYDQWLRWERYSDDDNGGNNGSMRLWRNGSLVGETNGPVTGCAPHFGNVRFNAYFAFDFIDTHNPCPATGSACSEIEHATKACCNSKNYYRCTGGTWQNLGTVVPTPAPTTADEFCLAGSEPCSCPATPTSCTAEQEGLTRYCCIDRHFVECANGSWGDFGDNLPPNRPAVDAYTDEVYVDNTLARVEICPNSDWNNRGACEIQLPVEWRTDQVRIALNQGALPADTDSYLFVVTGSGQASNPSTLRFVQTTDTLAPAAPANLRATSN